MIGDQYETPTLNDYHDYVSPWTIPQPKSPYFEISKWAILPNNQQMAEKARPVVVDLSVQDELLHQAGIKATFKEKRASF